MSASTHDSWKFLKEALAPWPAACDFVEKLTFVLHVWDDLIDRDHSLDDKTINSAFWSILIDLPRNPFYQQNFATLSSLLQQAILNWHIATAAERSGTDEDKVVAFVLRSSYTDVIAAALVICYGPIQALPIIAKLRQGAHNEGLAGYLAALAEEKEARDGLR